MRRLQPGSKYIILLLGALTTISPLSIDMYLPAFSQIAEDFGSTTAQVSLSLSSYFIGLAIGQMLYGPLLDRYGRKRPLYAGLAIFMVASIGCMQSGTVESLVAFRFIQAVGGCVAWVGAMTMVRDFFPVEESAKIFSLLILILGVSPLLAPTLGGLITAALSWQWIFVSLIIIVTLILIATFIFLPEGQAPDPTVTLKVRPMTNVFFSILRQPQFATYSFSGAFAFSALFIYLAGSPVIFMEVFHVSPAVYGGLFALMSAGFIGSSQLNILVMRKHSSEKIFRVALFCQVAISLVLLIGVWNDYLNLYSTVIIFLMLLSCLGFINPNANALALAPFTKNIGSASALIGCIQIGVAGLVSASVGLFNSKDIFPIAITLAGCTWIALAILLAGLKKIGRITASEISPGHMSH